MLKYNLFLKNNFFTIFLILLLLILSFVSIFIGVIDIKILDVFTDNDKFDIVLISRLPRLLSIICTGMGMSIAGLIMQQICMNKFISPSTGTTISSAQLGILISFIFIPNSNIFSRAVFAFIISLLSTLVFIYFIQKLIIKDMLLIPLVGIMLGNIISSFTNFLAFKYEMNQALSSWLVGHFSLIIRGKYELVYLVLPMIILAFLYAKYFNIVAMGKDVSINLGINYSIIVFIGLFISSAITASIIVIVGSISYIGLIVPNIISIIKGDNLKNIMFDTAIFGANFVLLCDIIARLIIFPYELPIELIIGVIGSFVFLILLFNKINLKKNITFSDCAGKDI